MRISDWSSDVCSSDLRFGPSLLFLRYDRIEFWPDKRGVVRRHLSQLLSGQDAEALQPRTFANGSVAVQGFPALERLLFDSDDDTWAMPFGCDVVRAIGTNLKSIAAGPQIGRASCRERVCRDG